MDATTGSEPTLMKNNATVERKSERGLLGTRTVNGPALIVFEAWTKPQAARAMVGTEVVSHPTAFLRDGCSGTARVPSGVRLRGLDHGVLRSLPRSDTAPRLVWTNDEGDEGGTVTTVTFEETG